MTPMASPVITMTTAAPARLGDTAHADVRGWMTLAVASFSLAALLALLLAASRTPLVMDALPADWEVTFRRILVSHVIFSAMVWCLAALAGLCAAASHGARGAWLGRTGLSAAATGTVLLLLPTLTGQGEPVMSDYVPVLDHPLYRLGLVLICGGVALPVLRLLLFGRDLGKPLPFALVVAGLAALSGFSSFVIAALRLPGGLDTLVHSQLLYWGGGHVLQFAYTALTLGIWHVLADRAFGRPPLAALPFRLLLATFLPCVLAGPPLVAALDLLDGHYLMIFTDLMRWGLVAAPAMIGAAVTLQAWRQRRDLTHPAAIALLLSVTLFGLGGLAGYFSPGGDTRTPGHYHASLSAVNLALMGLLWTHVLPLLGRGHGGLRLVRLQLWAFGAGQLVFAAGMFLAGSAGVPRKTAGAAQDLDTLVKALSMGLAGLGGVIAVIAGVVFAAVVLWHLMRRVERL